MTRQQDTYRRIRNTFRYLLGNLADFSPENIVPYNALFGIDKWALHQLEILKNRVKEAYNTYEFHQVYHAAHNFCTVHMSAFYLDVLKDRLYTYAANSTGRKSAQTVLAVVLDHLVRLLAPVLPFTCEEVWRHLPASLKTAESVHLTEFPAENPEHLLPEELITRWDNLLRIRGQVSKQLEEARRAEMIGSSLQAAVSLVPGDEEVLNVLNQFRDQLEDIFIVSKCVIEPIADIPETAEARVAVTVSVAPGKKCVRCWHIRETVGTIEHHPDICHVCAKQLGVTPG